MMRALLRRLFTLLVPGTVLAITLWAFLLVLNLSFGGYVINAARDVSLALLNAYSWHYQRRRAGSGS